MAGPPGNSPRSATAVYKVFEDGREELVRSVEIAELSAVTFKEIVAASRTPTVYAAPFSARDPNPFASIFALGPDLDSDRPVVSAVVPAILFDELTLKKPSGEFPTVPVTKHPYFEK